MKVAIVTDTHCGSGNDNKHLNEYFIKFYEDVFFPYIETNNIKSVIHLGDTFDRRKYVNFSTLSSWRERVFDRLSKFCERVDILIGNHDTYYKHTNAINSVFELLSIYKNFNIYGNAKEISFDKLNILYLPWICDDNYEKSIDLINKSTSKVCMGHLEISGFEMYPGRLSEGGFDSKTFDKFYITFSGHYHQKSSSGGIHYLGAPYPMMWGDYGAKRGFHIFDTETLQIEFIENTIEMFYKLKYDDAEKGVRDSILNEDHTHLTDKFVKILVSNKTDPYLFDKFIEAIQQVNPADLSVVENSTDMSFLEEAEIDQTKDTITILNECVDVLPCPTSDSTDLSDADRYRTDLKDKIRDIYLESLSHNEHIQSKA